MESEEKVAVSWLLIVATCNYSLGTTRVRSCLLLLQLELLTRIVVSGGRPCHQSSLGRKSITAVYKFQHPSTFPDRKSPNIIEMYKSTQTGLVHIYIYETCIYIYIYTVWDKLYPYLDRYAAARRKIWAVVRALWRVNGMNFCRPSVVPELSQESFQERSFVMYW